jgi:hypothetical protein
VLRSHRSSRLARRLGAVLLAASVLPVSAGTVMAADPAQYVLDVFSCGVFDQEGNPLEENVIPAGSELLLFEGWIAKTRGQVVSFSNNVTWVLTVNDEPVDVTPFLSGAINLGPFWGNLFSVSAGTLGSGDSIETHYDNVLKSASFDGSVHWKQGSTYGGGVDCTVTAV